MSAKQPLQLLCLCAMVTSLSFTPASSQEPEKKPKIKIISKDVVYSTSPEEGLKKRVQAVYTRTDNRENVPVYPYSFSLKMIHQDAGGMGASNIALVRGDDITQAIQVTQSVFAGGQTADKAPFPELNKKTQKMWLVAYLGTGTSTPPRWNYDSVVIDGKSIEFKFKKSNSTLIALDTILYFYWIPLGSLDAGTYELRLFDLDRGRPTLSRWVGIDKGK